VPATEDLLEDELGDNYSRIGGGSASFRIRSQSTASMEYVAVVSGLRHEEGIDMSLAEQRGDVGTVGGI